MKRWFANPENRKWLYTVAIAVFAVLSAYGLVQPEKVPLWVELVGNLLGISGFGLARAHVYPQVTIGPADPPAQAPDTLG